MARLDPIPARSHGPLWIALGVAWIGLAQMGEGLPLATAVVVIGCGAVEIAGRPGRRYFQGVRWQAGMVPLANLLVYVGLAGLTIAAQWDLALRSPAGRVGLLLAVDHALALFLLARLTWRTTNHWTV